MRKFLTVTLALVGIFFVMAACSPSPEKRAEWMTSKLSSNLDLNKEQKAKLDAAKDTILEIRKAHQGDQKKNVEEVKKMIAGEKLDAAQVKALINQRQKMVDDNFDKVFAKVSDFHASLTPDQKKKAVSLIEKFTEHWKD